MSTEVYHKVRSTGAGKGDANRITDREAFRSNYDNIDWNQPIFVPHCRYCDAPRDLVDGSCSGCGEEWE